MAWARRLEAREPTDREYARLGSWLLESEEHREALIGAANFCAL
jgi:hypothetical protein